MKKKIALIIFYILFIFLNSCSSSRVRYVSDYPSWWQRKIDHKNDKNYSYGYGSSNIEISAESTAVNQAIKVIEDRFDIDIDVESAGELLERGYAKNKEIIIQNHAIIRREDKTECLIQLSVSDYYIETSNPELAMQRRADLKEIDDIYNKAVSFYKNYDDMTAINLLLKASLIANNSKLYTGKHTQQSLFLEALSMLKRIDFKVSNFDELTLSGVVLLKRSVNILKDNVKDGKVKFTMYNSENKPYFTQTFASDKNAVIKFAPTFGYTQKSGAINLKLDLEYSAKDFENFSNKELVDDFFKIIDEKTFYYEFDSKIIDKKIAFFEILIDENNNLYTSTAAEDIIKEHSNIYTAFDIYHVDEIVSISEVIQYIENDVSFKKYDIIAINIVSINNVKKIPSFFVVHALNDFSYYDPNKGKYLKEYDKSECLGRADNYAGAIEDCFTRQAVIVSKNLMDFIHHEKLKNLI